MDLYGLTPESLPDDMQTTVWVTEHRDLIVTMLDAMADWATASELLATHQRTLVVDTGPPAWFTTLSEQVSSSFGNTMVGQTTLAVMLKVALGLNQSIDHDQPA